MKNYFISLITLVVFGSFSFGQDLSPYIKVGKSTGSIESVASEVKNALKTNGFEILGTYNPSGKSTLKVIAFTNYALKSKAVKVSDRGALAAVLKVGLEKKDGQVYISYTNPDYLLRAYLMENFETYKTTFVKFSKDLKTALSGLGDDFTPFGGTVKAEKLKKYHYKIMMPYFTDPVALQEYDSFETGVTKIQNNLSARKGNTKLVYKLIYPDKKVAVFGVGLNSKQEGEAHFLPKIGEAHVAALPYEIILQGNKATMLHGKYRIALHWPDLTMGTFMKIMSTPGDIEDALEAVCE
ncbi:hypothetical protein [Winogradskyella vincentii]|uniref:DUF302 domain-containing protein n=1 Tax=Winogradskyella vincentii TaxID=2877122 RepID=A0ABS7Y355_9FLAO|nr:hypothetical protein [Winogradskyella vincentii]MCA0154360.1 hypothetical protein [Winogradskyella vincentii]